MGVCVCLCEHSHNGVQRDRPQTCCGVGTDGLGVIVPVEKVDRVLTGLKKGRQGEKGNGLREGLRERFGLGLFYATHWETQTGQVGT